MEEFKKIDVNFNIHTEIFRQIDNVQDIVRMFLKFDKILFKMKNDKYSKFLYKSIIDVNALSIMETIHGKKIMLSDLTNNFSEKIKNKYDEKTYKYFLKIYDIDENIKGIQKLSKKIY